MFEDFPKLLELGALGSICFILIFKGIGKMQNLTDCINVLTNKINEINITVTNHFNVVDNRLDLLERDLRDIKFDINTLARRLDNGTEQNNRKPL